MSSKEWKLASDGITFPKEQKGSDCKLGWTANLRPKRRKKMATGFDEWEIILPETALKHRFHRGSRLLTIPVR